MAMMPLKVDDDSILKAINDGNPYIEIGHRKFMLFEVEEINQEGTYDVTDEEEARLLFEALEENNPIQTYDEISSLLADQKKK